MNQLGEENKIGSLTGERKLTQADLYEMFPRKAIEGVKTLDFVHISPRKGTTFVEVETPSISGKKNVTGWRFSNITLEPKDALNWGLQTGEITLDYWGGYEDIRLLVKLLEVIGQPKDKEHAGFMLFSQLASVGVFGGDVRSDSYRNTRLYQQTPQRALFETAVTTVKKPILTILAHGGSAVNTQGRKVKTIGNLQGTEKVYLANYINTLNQPDYSAIIDVSCTDTFEYCTKEFPKELTKGHPPFFGTLEENDRGLGMNLTDTYTIINKQAQIFKKPR